MTKDELMMKLADEYSDNYDKIDELDNEINAINRKKLLSKIGVTALFGVIPALIISFINSRLCIKGILDISTLPIINFAATSGIAVLNNFLYERKGKFKEAEKEYNLTNDQRDLIEREVELGIKKKQIESKNSIIQKYYHELQEAKNLEIVDVTKTEDDKTKLEVLKRKLDKASKRMFINDRLCDYKNGSKSEIKTATCGAVLALATSLMLLYMPHLMMGVLVKHLPIYATLIGFGSLLFGSTIGLQNTMIHQAIYDKKNKELGSLAIPNQTEPQYIPSFSLLSDISKEYLEALKEMDGVRIVHETEEKEEVVETTQTITPVKEDVIKLEKKY